MTMNQVLSVITTLFSSASAATVTPKQRKEADEWLKSFQRTPQAWEIADTLINSEEAPLEARLFAAQTFRQKIAYDLDQLDLVSRQSLYQSMFQLLYSHRNSSRSLVTQLVLSLADLSIILVEHVDPIQHLLESYSEQTDMIHCILEFLTVLPEELNDHRLLTSDEIQITAQKLLVQNANKVLHFLLQVDELTDYASSTTEYKLACLCSWIKSGDLKVKDLVQTPLLGESFQALSVESGFDVGCDLISEIIYRATKQPRDMALVELVYNYLLPLGQKLQDSMDDCEKVRGLCRVFVEAGECFCDLLVSAPQLFKGILDGILVCSSYDELEVVQITFSFWHMLTDELMLKPETLQNPYFAQVYSQLVDVIIKHLHYPPDLDSWTAAEKDEFREFRHTMGDVLKDCVRVLGEEVALMKPFLQISEQMSRGITEWQALEAPLFSLRTMCGEVSVSESKILPQIMALLPNLPQHPKIRYAVILVMGRYAEWTNVHPEFIQYQLQYVSSGFEDKGSVAAAAQTLRDLCKFCGKHLVDYLPQLHTFYVNIMNALPYQDKRQVIEAIAHVLSALPQEALLASIQSFCLPIIQRLHAISVSPVQSDELIKETTDLIDSFAVFLKHLTPNIPQCSVHPCVSILTEVWPTLKVLLNQYGRVQKCAEAGARLLKSCIVSYRLFLGPILPEWAESLCLFFEQSGFGCWLWVCTKFVKFFGGPDKPTAHMVPLLVERMTLAVYKLFSQTSDMDSVDEVIEDYFYFLEEYLEQSPHAFVSSPLLPVMFQCSVKSLQCTSAASLIADYSWLISLLESLYKGRIPQEVSGPLVQLLVDPTQGGALIQASFQGLLRSFPREREVVSFVSNCLRAYHSCLSDTLLTFVNTLLDNFTEEQIPSTIKINFKEKFARTIVDPSPSKLSSVLQDFSASLTRRHFKLERQGV